MVSFPKMPMCSGKEGMEPQSSWYKSYLGANPTHCMLWVPRRPPRETQVWTWELWVCHGAGASPVWPEWEFPAGRVGAELGRASELVGGGFPCHTRSCQKREPLHVTSREPCLPLPVTGQRVKNTYEEKMCVTQIAYWGHFMTIKDNSFTFQ